MVTTMECSQWVWEMMNDAVEKRIWTIFFFPNIGCWGNLAILAWKNRISSENLIFNIGVYKNIESSPNFAHIFVFALSIGLLHKNDAMSRHLTVETWEKDEPQAGFLQQEKEKEIKCVYFLVLTLLWTLCLHNQVVLLSDFFTVCVRSSKHIL